MILCGRTPHALGRTAGLALLALAVLLTGFAPAQEHTEKKETLFYRAAGPAAGKADELKQLEAELARATQAVEALRQRIEQAKRAKSAASATKALTERLSTLRQTKEAVKAAGPTIRIEIASDMKANDLKELIAAIEKAVPGADKRVMILVGGEGRRAATVIGSEGKRVEVVTPGMTMKGMSAYVTRGAMGGAAVIPAVPPTPPTPATGKIEGLEKKLDAVLRELEALRKEMRGPRPGGGRFGPGGGGAGGGGPGGGAGGGGPPGAGAPGGVGFPGAPGGNTPPSGGVAR